MPKAKSDVKAKVANTRSKRKAAVAATGAINQIKKKANIKDPNKPKRPPTPFFVFMAEFREQYKKEHPNNKSVAVVGKAGGNKWKAMSDAEKAPFVARAEKKKLQYEKDMKAYNKEVVGDKNPSDGESDKSKSEVNNYEDGEEVDES